MRVEQAVYGELRGGHGLLMASHPGMVSSELTSRLDLPDTAPPGADWSAFLSGFPHGDHYVFARTFSDPAATRAGMVLSHAVIAPLAGVVATADLRPLLALLITAPELPTTLEACEVPASSTQPPVAADLVAAAEALTTRGTGPVVRLGHQGFEELVVSLWFHLWVEIRAQFAFRLSFGPADLIDTPSPSLVCTPKPLAARWTGHRIVGSTAPKAVSRAAALLYGGAEAEPVLDFAREIGAQLKSLSDLRLLERAYELGSAPTATFAERVAVLRLVERLSPDPAAGPAGKARLVEGVASHLPVASVRDIFLLRNLGSAAFPAADTVWASLREWVSRNSLTEDEDGPLLSAIDDAMSTAAAVPAWREAILGGMADASRDESSAFPTAFWRWTDAQPATLIALADHLPLDREVEARLAELAPRKLAQATGDAVMALAISKRWLRLHGATVGATLPLADAIHRQVSVDTDPTYMDGVRAVLRQATPAEALAIALKMADPRVLHIAAEQVAREPHVLEAVDFHDAPAQEIWARSLMMNAGSWDGPADPQQAFAAVLNNLIDDKPANADVIAALSSSPIADLSAYPRRAEVWSRVGGATRTNLLKATAAGWLNHAMSATVPYGPDPVLESALLEGDTLDQALRTLFQTDVAAVAGIVAALSGYDEPRFIGQLGGLVAARRPLATSEAEALGRLVLERRWKRAVDDLVDLVRTGRNDLKPALNVCHAMISIFTRWSLGLSSISYEQKWQVLGELATDLYPSGPDHNELWSRAGGRNADLQSYGSGDGRWRDALEHMRRGQGPRAERVLGEMARDFPWNEHLRYLAADPDFRGDSRR